MARTFVKLVAAACVCALTAGLAGAQWNPARPIRYIVPYSTGSATDALTRLIAIRLSEQLGWSVVVDNQPGANGIPATATVAKAAPDGYTLIMIAANHVINAGLYSKLPYDTVRDFRAIIRIANAPFVLTVHPSLPVRSVKELIELARARPGQLDYASPGNGSPAHLSTELFKSMTGVNLTHIPYKGAAQAQADLIGGQVPVMFVVMAAAIPQVKADKLRALGVSSLRRLPQLADVPSMDEAGLKGFEVLSWIGTAGPAGLPNEIVLRLHDEISKVTNQAEVKQRIEGLGLLAFPAGAQEFATYMANEHSRWADMVKRAGARLD